MTITPKVLRAHTQACIAIAARGPSPDAPCPLPLITARLVRRRHQVRWVQGYRLPERFPRHFYDGAPQPLAFATDVGSVDSPIPYHHFACMFRPLLERQYQDYTGIWAKRALVATMWVPEER